MTAEVARTPSFPQSPSLGPANPIAMASPLDQAVDSPASVAAFVLRCQQEVGNHARATLATKLASLCDSTLRASFIDHGGLSVLTEWLDDSSPLAVILHSLEALATLPLTADQLASNSQLLTRLDQLKHHSDERISSLADDTYSAFQNKLNGPSEVDVDVLDGDEAHSKFRTIKIDKSTNDVQHVVPTVDQSVVESSDQATKLTLDQATKPTLEQTSNQTIEQQTSIQSSNVPTAEDEVAFEEASTPQLDPSPANHQLIKQLSNQSNKKPKKPRRSVTWRDDAIESVKLFHRDEWIVPAVDQSNSQSNHQAIKQGAAANKQSNQLLPLRPTIDWRTPARITLPQSIQSTNQSRGKESTERINQPTRESRSLQSFVRPHELPHDPLDDPSVSQSVNQGVEVTILPFDTPQQQPAYQPQTQQAPPQNDLLAKLNSLASMIKTSNQPAAASQPSYQPVAQPTHQSVSQSNSPSISSSLASLMSTLKSVPTANQPASQSASQPSKLLSLLSGTSSSAPSATQSSGQSVTQSLNQALGSLAAALAKPPANQPIQSAASVSRWSAAPPSNYQSTYQSSSQPSYAPAPNTHSGYQPAPVSHQPANYQYPQYGAPHYQPNGHPINQPINRPAQPAYQYPPSNQPPVQQAAPYQYGYQQPPAAAPYYGQQPQPAQPSYQPNAQPSYQPVNQPAYQQPTYQPAYQPSSINQSTYQPSSINQSNNQYQPINHKRKPETEIDHRATRPRTVV